MTSTSIVFIKPNNDQAYGVFAPLRFRYPPLGILYLGAVLQQHGYRWDLIDLDLFPDATSRLIPRLMQLRPTYIGFSVTTADVLRCAELARQIRAVLPQVKIIFGGPHPSNCPEETVEHFGADIVVRGEGEMPLLAILQGQRLQDIPALTFLHEGEICSTPDALSLLNLDQLPFPERRTEWIRATRNVLDSRRRPIANILTSRGCPAKCIFCETRVRGYRFRGRSPGNVMAEVEQLVAEHGIRELHIMDSNFTHDRDRAGELLEMLARRDLGLGIVLCQGIRVDRLDREMARLLARAGVHSVFVGGESGQEESLKLLKKRTTPAQISRAIDSLHDEGIDVRTGVLYGIAGERKNDVMRSIDFYCRQKVTFLEINPLVPFPGTRLHAMVKDRLLFQTYSEMTFQTEGLLYGQEDLSPQDIEHIQRYHFLRFYLRPATVGRHILRLVRSPALTWSYLLIVAVYLRLMGRGLWRWLVRRQRPSQPAS